MKTIKQYSCSDLKVGLCWVRMITREDELKVSVMFVKITNEYDPDLQKYPYQVETVTDGNMNVIAFDADSLLLSLNAMSSYVITEEEYENHKTIHTV